MAKPVVLNTIKPTFEKINFFTQNFPSNFLMAKIFFSPYFDDWSYFSIYINRLSNKNEAVKLIFGYFTTPYVPYLCTLLAQRREAHNLVQEEEGERLEELISSLVYN